MDRESAMARLIQALTAMPSAGEQIMASGRRNEAAYDAGGVRGLLAQGVDAESPIAGAFAGSTVGKMAPAILKGASAPIRAYHGSQDRTLKSIKKRHAVETPGATFHASNPDVAETFTVPREYGEPVFYTDSGKEIKRGRVYETEITPRNLLEWPSETAQKFIDDSSFQKRAVDYAKTLDHDAIKASNVFEGIGERSPTDVYAVLDDRIIEILRKYGLAGVTAGAAAGAGGEDALARGRLAAALAGE